MNDETIEYFTHAMTAWIQNHDVDRAKQILLHIATEMDSEQCDAHMMLAKLQGEDVSPAIIETAYRTRRTYGQLLTASGHSSLIGKFLDGGWKNSFRFPYFSITRTYRSELDIVLAYAMMKLEAGLYDDAIAALDDAKPRIPIVSLARAMVYYTTKRWSDVVDSTGPTLSAKMHDLVSNSPTGYEDYLTMRSGQLMAGIAYARLGRLDMAVEMLDQARADTVNVKTGEPQGGYILIASEALYWLGLIERERGSEEDAQKRFALAVKYAQLPQLLEAADDPGIRLKFTSAEMIQQRTSYWDPTTEPDYGERQDAAKKVRREKLLAQSEAELDEMIGLSEVKDKIHHLRDDEEYKMIRKAAGLEVFGHSAMHMVFEGPPGTGKTVCAEIVGKIYAGLGIVDKEEVKVVTRNDFLGQYQGHTTEKTNKLIADALDGVLFIDEAYSLVNVEGNDMFGTEARDELLRLVEFYHDRLIVILAGYPHEMDQLLETNPGFASRFTTRIRFTSYGPDEIAQIAELVAVKRGSILDPAARQAIVDIATVLRGKDHRGRVMIDKAGNGRFARNIITKAEPYRSSRIVNSPMRGSLTPEEIKTFTYTDIKQSIDEITRPILYQDATSDA